MKFSDTICVKFHEDYDQTAVEDKLPVSIERPINFYALDFGKIKVEKLSSMNWIFILQKSISRLIFAGYTGSKNPVRNRLKIQFVKLDFSDLIFRGGKLYKN